MAEHPGLLWRRIIDASSITQRELAARMGVSARHLNLICNGKHRPNPVHTVLFAKAMDADLDEVWAVQCAWELEHAKAVATEWIGTRPFP